MQSKWVLILLALAIVSCQKTASPKGKLKNPKQMALVIGDPVTYGEGDLLVFPIGANYNPEIQEKPEYSYSENQKVEDHVSLKNRSSGSFTLNDANTFKYDKDARQEFVNSNEEDFDMRNILFYNKLTGKSYILSTDTLHILSFAVHREFKNPLIFYRVVKKDINMDKKYNSEDAVMLYVSATDGKSLMQISPENEQFYDYFYYPETQSILIKTALDIDNDNKFTKLDETVFREMRLNTPAFGREIFPEDLKDNLKAQICVLK